MTALILSSIVWGKPLQVWRARQVWRNHPKKKWLNYDPHSTVTFNYFITSSTNCEMYCFELQQLFSLCSSQRSSDEGGRDESSPSESLTWFYFQIKYLMLNCLFFFMSDSDGLWFLAHFTFLLKSVPTISTITLYKYCYPQVIKNTSLVYSSIGQTEGASYHPIPSIGLCQNVVSLCPQCIMIGAANVAPSC